ncbi:hypothetical protein GW17_00058604 [Ensete ventricosum]|nr:hypothetical protein GW17_00058604 [Ensete ventricosum]
MARLLARGWPTSAKAPLQRGNRLRPGPLQGAVARRGSSPQGAATCRATIARGHDRCGRLRPGPLQGRPPAGAAARNGQPPAGAVAARGHDQLQPGHKGWLPAALLQVGDR